MCKEIEAHQIIAKMSAESIEELKGLIPIEEIEILKKPKQGLLMMTAKDSFNTNFYLGEILVTEAEVKYKDMEGYAMLICDDPEKALLAASVNAILKTNDQNLKQKVFELITDQARKMEELDEIEGRLIAKTKVNFETMVKR